MARGDAMKLQASWQATDSIHDIGLLHAQYGHRFCSDLGRLLPANALRVVRIDVLCHGLFCCFSTSGSTYHACGLWARQQETGPRRSALAHRTASTSWVRIPSMCKVLLVQLELGVGTDSGLALGTTRCKNTTRRQQAANELPALSSSQLG